MTEIPLIEIRDLQIIFHGDDGRATHAVDRVDLSVAKGATLGLVGESGCGKSVTSLAIMGLLSKQSSEVSGSIRFDGFDLLDVPDQTLRDLRGNRLAMIFQEPMTSLNPSFTIGDQIIETILRHRGGSRRNARERAIELLEKVGITPAGERLGQFPHQLSGGLRQRAMIAMALAAGPRLLIADEPTTALDVTVQKQILDLLDRLRRELKLGLLFITHDLGVVAQVAERVAVMYAGRIIEEGPTREVLAKPLHPYTQGLLRASPTLKRGTLTPIPGAVPQLTALPPGCAFEPRCELRRAECAAAIPALRIIGSDHAARCILV